MVTNPDLRRPYARHLGGVNLGFLDGHASWWNSERLLAKVAESGGKDVDQMGFHLIEASASWCILEETGQQWPTLY